MDKLTAIKIKYADGTYSDEIPVSVLSKNVEWDSTHTLVDILGSIDVDTTGTIQDQINRLFNEKVSATQLQNYVASQLNEDVSTWLNNNVDPVGSAVVVDKSLTVAGAAADAKIVGDNISDLKEDLGAPVSQINNEKVFDKYIINYMDFDIGYIWIKNTGWEYGNNNKAVRTKQGTTLSLKKGDKIYLKDYTDAKVYIGWLADGIYGTQYWVGSGEFTCSTDGEYVLLLMNKTEAVQTSINALLDLLVIDSVEGRVKLLENSLDEVERNIRLNVMPYTPIEKDVSNVEYNGIVTCFGNILFKADSATVESSGKNWSGLQTKFALKQGRTIYAKASRNGGNGYICRLNFFNNEGTSVYSVAGSSNGEPVSVLVAENYASCEVTFAIAWGTVVPSGETVTFSNIEIGYTDLLDSELSKTSTNPVQNKAIALEFPSFKMQNKGGKSIEFSDYFNNVDNMLFCCENVKCISSTASYEGITITFRPLIKGRYLCFRAKRDYTGNSFAYRMFTFNAENQQIGYAATQIDETVIKLFIGNDVDHVQIDVATNWTNAVTADVEYNISDIALYYDDGFSNSVGEGELVYYGREKLAVVKNTYQMKKSDIKVYTQTEWTALTDETYGTNQSLAIYGKWFFVINEGCKSIVYDSENDTSYAFSLADRHHHNSAQFIDVYYDADDEFPLLMVSDCQFNIPDATISVYRITRAETTFIATLIKTIAIDIYEPKNYGFSALFDTQRRKIIVFYNTKGLWNVFPDNPVNMSEFPEPEWSNGETVTYTKTHESVLNTFPYFVVQGIGYFNGLYYLATAISANGGYYPTEMGIIGNYVFVFNPIGELLNMIPTGAHEAEGTAIKNGSLYLSSRDGNYDRDVDKTVCWITKFDF